MKKKTIMQIVMNILLGGQGFPVVSLPSAHKQAKYFALSPSPPNEGDISEQRLLTLSPHIFGRSHIPKENFFLKIFNLKNK
jgi:hypothetical protein